MSSATKKKYVRAEVENDFSLPENNQTIVRVCLILVISKLLSVFFSTKVILVF